jgi:hypothetical protein
MLLALAMGAVITGLVKIHAIAMVALEQLY